ncbi:MAG: HAMP domain-containing histidine kinase [Opitutaceae bacterium]|nr:HAMP domain-containing histidine kinase [Verrucomicrobiales bacterium]
MKKVALVFLLAVFVPSLVLGWLAFRSLRDQQFVLERQQSIIYQGVADAVVREAQSYLTGLQSEFGMQAELLLRRETNNLPAAFDRAIRQAWPYAKVGFAVSLDGKVLSPSLFDRPDARQFRQENDRFLCSVESVEVYWNNKLGTQIPVEQSQTPGERSYYGQSGKSQQPSQPTGKNISGYNSSSEWAGQQAMPNRAQNESPDSSTLNGILQSRGQKRNVEPQNQQQQTQLDAQIFSKIAPAEADFRQLVNGADQGTVARFLQNKLNLMFWHRSSRDTNLIFGALVDLSRLIGELKDIDQLTAEDLTNACMALLDDTGRPVMISRPGFQTNWKKPIAAAEIGEALPHWEVAVYLLDPGKLSRAAQSTRQTVGSLVVLLLLAISVGGWLLVSGVRIQLALARKKTDFVSNVSHELKTPLTSIRMFSELLAEGRVTDPDKQRSYLNIISAEAGRLTRLINNVLDFSRLERGEKKYQFQPMDLAAVVRETIETHRPHLEAGQFQIESVLPAEPVTINGDRDALAQILVNLLSNAEKYSGAGREIRVEMDSRTEPVCHVEVRVLDRGTGVPAGSEQKIFDQFYRAHDSLSSGIQGSGLGLTLARQIARAHGGDVVYERREGGGSCFTLRLPCKL